MLLLGLQAHRGQRRCQLGDSQVDSRLFLVHASGLAVGSENDDSTLHNSIASNASFHSLACDSMIGVTQETEKRQGIQELRQTKPTVAERLVKGVGLIHKKRIGAKVFPRILDKPVVIDARLLHHAEDTKVIQGCTERRKHRQGQRLLAAEQSSRSPHGKAQATRGTHVPPHNLAPPQHIDLLDDCCRLAGGGGAATSAVVVVGGGGSIGHRVRPLNLKFNQLRNKLHRRDKIGKREKIVAFKQHLGHVALLASSRQRSSEYSNTDLYLLTTASCTLAATMQGCSAMLAGTPTGDPAAA